MVGAVARLEARVKRLEDLVGAWRVKPRAPPEMPEPVNGTPAVPPAPSGWDLPRETSTIDQHIGAGEEATLAAIAQMQHAGCSIVMGLLSRMPRQGGYDQVTVAMVSAVTGFAERTIRNQLVVLRGLGFVETLSGGHRATRAGCEKVVGFAAHNMGVGLMDQWLEKLPDGESRVLDYVGEHGHVMVRSIEVGIAPRTVRNCVVSLVRRCLLVRDGRGAVKLAPILVEP